MNQTVRRINSAARFHCAPDWSWDTRAVTMPDRDVWVVVGGLGRMTRFAPEREVVRLARGDVFVLGEDDKVLAEHDPSEPLIVIAVHFEGGPDLGTHYRVQPIEFLAGLLDRCLRARLLADPDAACRWLDLALNEIGSSTAGRDRTGAARDDAVRSLMDEIRDRPGDDWRVSTIADRMGVSQQHAGRLFRESSGRSPKEYVIEARTQAAKAYLEGSSLPVKRIAMELGYHDEFHFSRQFGGRVGMSPSAWRERLISP